MGVKSLEACISSLSIIPILRVEAFKSPDPKHCIPAWEGNIGMRGDEHVRTNVCVRNSKWCAGNSDKHLVPFYICTWLVHGIRAGSLQRQMQEKPVEEQGTVARAGIREGRWRMTGLDALPLSPYFVYIGIPPETAFLDYLHIRAFSTSL